MLGSRWRSGGEDHIYSGREHTGRGLSDKATWAERKATHSNPSGQVWVWNIELKGKERGGGREKKEGREKEKENVSSQ